MPLTKEEEDLFGPVVAAAADSFDAEDFTADDVPPPAITWRAPGKLEIMPACQACGVDLNPDNAAKLQTGKWVHIGCPAAAAILPPDAPANDANAPAPAKKRGRPAKVPEIPMTPDATTAGVTTATALSAQRLARALRAAADALEQP